jgi:hypothetical protein
LMMLMLASIEPGCVCMDTTCPTGEVVPHMANDGGNHPHPWGLIPTGPPKRWSERWWKRAPAC